MIDCHYHIRSTKVKEDIQTAVEHVKKYSLDKLVILATYFPTVGSGVSNYRLFHQISKQDSLYMFCSLDFNNYYFMNINEITELIEEEKVLGIKIYTGYQDIDLKSSKLDDIFKLAQKYNKTVMFHTGYCHASKFEETIIFNPINLEPLIKKYKDVKVLLAHMGNPCELEIVHLTNNYKNVYTDISGLMEREDQLNEAKEYFNYLIKKIPIEKIMYGTDYPVQNYENTEKIISDISIENQLKIKENPKELF